MLFLSEIKFNHTYFKGLVAVIESEKVKYVQ